MVAGIGVDEHDLIALLAQHLAGLHARVVELGGLPDDDGTGAEDQDLVDVLAPRQCALQKTVEEVEAVVRSGPGLGVVLDGPAGNVEQLETLDGAVVEVHVRQLGGAEVGLPAHGLIGIDRAGAIGPSAAKP